MSNGSPGMSSRRETTAPNAEHTAKSPAAATANLSLTRAHTSRWPAAADPTHPKLKGLKVEHCQSGTVRPSAWSIV
jgi:hypothetical protein